MFLKYLVLIYPDGVIICLLKYAGIESYGDSMTNVMYEGWNFNSGNYLFTTDTK